MVISCSVDCIVVLSKMRIKKSRKRSTLRFLVRVGLIVAIVWIGLLTFSISRINNNTDAPNYRDGDLVFKKRWDNDAFLLIRVRGFEE